MWKALKEEIKHTIGGSIFHVVRFLVILLIPFVLGMTTYMAFENPFNKGKNLNMTVLVDKDDVLGNEIAKQIAEEKSIQAGDLNIDLNFGVKQVDDIASVPQDIYNENQLVIKIAGEDAQGFTVPLDEAVNKNRRPGWDVTDGWLAGPDGKWRIEHAPAGIGQQYIDYQSTDDVFNNALWYPFYGDTIAEIISIVDFDRPQWAYTSNDRLGQPVYWGTGGEFQSVFFVTDDIYSIIDNSISLYNNYNNDYFMAFGIDKTIMDNSLHRMIVADAFNAIAGKSDQQGYSDYEYLEYLNNNHYADVPINSSLHDTFYSFFAQYATGIDRVNELNNSLVWSTADFGKLPDSGFGYGVLPIILAASIWIGAVIMVFTFRRRVYENKATPHQRYFAKSIVMAACVLIQVTLLMLSLMWIGFDQVGWSHWGAMYGFAIMMGIIVTEIIQAINVIVHSKSAGFLIVLMLTGLQLVTSGGLFPADTLSDGMLVFGQIFPLSHLAGIFKELSFATDWAQVGIDIALLLPWLLLVPIAIFMENKRDKKYVAQHSFAIKGRTMFHIGGKGGVEW